MSTTPPAARPGGWNARFGPNAAWRRTIWGDALGEFLGTFVLIMFGLGSVAMTVAALNQSGRGAVPFDATGDWIVIALGWGFGVTFGVHIAGGITGAHLNPAVTLAFALKRGFAWSKVPVYMLAQLAGAFVGAAIVYWVYAAAIGSFERANDIVRGTIDSVPTFSIFATFPAGYFADVWGPLIDQVVGTALLVGIIFALVDNANLAPRSNIGPLIVGFVVLAIGLSFGANAGYAINPARDLGPRLWALIEGWKEIAVPGDYGNINSYMWIPIVGPLVGGALGAVVYDFFIGDVLRARHVPGAEIEETGRAIEEPPGAPATRTEGYVAPEATERVTTDHPRRGDPGAGP